MAGPTTDQLNDVTYESGINADGTVADPSFASWNQGTNNPATYTATQGFAFKWNNNSAGVTAADTSMAGTSGGTVTYAFNSSVSTAQQAAFVSTLTLWSDEANIKFAPASSTSASDVVFSVTSSGGTSNQSALQEYAQAGSVAIPAPFDPSSQAGSQDTITFNNSGSFGTIGSFSAQGGYAESAMTHEIGHMLGLGHTGPYNEGSSGSNPDAAQYDAFDSRQWSVMSYVDPSDTGAAYYSQYTVTGTHWTSADGYQVAPETPMIDDILSVQRLYGAPTSGPLTQAQTFGFNTTIGDASKSFFDFTVNVNPVITIYDSSSTGSTLDCSGFSTQCTINLNPGTFSTASAGTLTNNIGIAYGTKVDTAIGGSGNDTFTVNTDNDTINGGAGTNAVDFSGALAGYSIGQSGANTIVTNKSTNVVDTLANIQTLNFSDQSVSTACYASGTSIRTPRGDVAVEDLRVGDHIVTASGDDRPIRWLGHRVIDCRRHPRPDIILPVRIAAHAFGQGQPARDLVVSPGHAICVDLDGEALIPAASLINGSTIRQIAVETVTYWHVELDSHDILLAENLPAESFLDMGNKGFFAESGVVDLGAAPDAWVRTHVDFCRPMHEAGPLVDAVREDLRVRAEAAGWRLEGGDPFADLHLLVDGVRVDPARRGLAARFTVPAGAGDVWLVCDATRPCDVGMSGDARTLGVCLGGLTLDDGFTFRAIPLDDASLGAGLHQFEATHRWTAGHAQLPPALWSRCAGDFFLCVDLAGPALPRWVVPADEASSPHEAIAA